MRSSTFQIASELVISFLHSVFKFAPTFHVLFTDRVHGHDFGKEVSMDVQGCPDLYLEVNRLKNRSNTGDKLSRNYFEQIFENQTNCDEI